MQLKMLNNKNHITTKFNIMKNSIKIIAVLFVGALFLTSCSAPKHGCPGHIGETKIKQDSKSTIDYTIITVAE